MKISHNEWRSWKNFKGLIRDKHLNKKLSIIHFATQRHCQERMCYYDVPILNTE